MSSTRKELGRSFLFPNTNNGISASGGLLIKSCNSFLAVGNFSGSAESTTYLRKFDK